MQCVAAGLWNGSRSPRSLGRPSLSHHAQIAFILTTRGAKGVPAQFRMKLGREDPEMSRANATALPGVTILASLDTACGCDARARFCWCAAAEERFWCGQVIE